MLALEHSKRGDSLDCEIAPTAHRRILHRRENRESESYVAQHVFHQPEHVFRMFARMFCFVLIQHCALRRNIRAVTHSRTFFSQAQQHTAGWERKPTRLVSQRNSGRKCSLATLLTLCLCCSAAGFYAAASKNYSVSDCH